jgi:hypothetical protein
MFVDNTTLAAGIHYDFLVASASKNVFLDLANQTSVRGQSWHFAVPVV